jgi:hypothetical protein
MLNMTEEYCGCYAFVNRHACPYSVVGLFVRWNFFNSKKKWVGCFVGDAAGIEY